VFGVSASPFLLGATLNYHLDNVTGPLKETAERLKCSFYVDNCVTSVDTEAEAVKFQKEAVSVLESGQFD